MSVAILASGQVLMPEGEDHFDASAAMTADFDESLFCHVPTLDELLGRTVREASEPEGLMHADLIIDYAKNFIGTRYRRGAKGPKAFDCSGFTSYVFRKYGYSLSPASHLQGLQGEKIDLDSARPGDLIFFSGRRAGKRIGHVGMVTGINADGSVKFIHASCTKGVVVDTYPDGGYYSRRFISVRRVLPTL